MTLRTLFARLDEPVGRREYLIVGLVLSLTKFLVDATLIYLAAGIVWTPIDYLVPLVSMTGPKVVQFSPGLGLALLLFALPFIWIGVTMSVRRAEDAGVSPWWVVAFFLPGLNYLLMAVLAMLPSAARTASEIATRSSGRSPRRAVLLGGVVGALTGVLLTAAGLFGKAYGLALFVGTPFLMGALASYVCVRAGGVEPYRAILAAFLSLAAAGLALTLFAIEGVVCIVMAIPIASPIVLLGAIVGHSVARTHLTTYAGLAIVFALVPAGSVIEHAASAVPSRVVTTAIEVDAPPEQVWPFVVSFDQIAASPAWYFKTGLAYPLRARIVGTGVGATRYCEFTTGAFVEPITAWDAPHRLAFDVASHPPPLREWSPYSKVYAPHLDGYFRTERGEFRLIALAGGRTRLEGHSWYVLRMTPAPYWNMIADRILHDIHNRVLLHIKATAERTAFAHLPTPNSQLPKQNRSKS
jgi:uncharacterized membrane protein YhaH (DUF805 family)